jgi:hypothetical protein
MFYVLYQFVTYLLTLPRSMWKNITMAYFEALSRCLSLRDSGTESTRRITEGSNPTLHSYSREHLKAPTDDSTVNSACIPEISSYGRDNGYPD